MYMHFSNYVEMIMVAMGGMLMIEIKINTIIMLIIMMLMVITVTKMLPITASKLLV